MKTIALFCLCLCTSIANAKPFLTSAESLTPDGTKGIVNGIYYDYYDDGSGSFGKQENDSLGDNNWSTQCDIDKITDEKMCSMKMKGLWIYAYGKGKVIMSIGLEHFPGSSVTIRIDGGTPISNSSKNDGNYSAGASAKIIEKLKRSKTVTTRYMRWPYRTWVDETLDISGFNEAFKYINWAVKRIKEDGY